MSLFFHQSTVIALALLQASTAVPQTLDAKTDRDAYAIYATLLQSPRDTDGRVKKPILLQRETEGPSPTTCSGFLAGMSGEWVEVANSFRRENSRVRLLQAGVPIGVEYHLVSREEILARDALLAAQSPGMTNGVRPGSHEYVAVSAIGFNAARTKALVYVRSRISSHSDGIVMKELKDGQWVTGPYSCVGVA